MRTAIVIAALLLAMPARADELRNADHPLRGDWNFAPRLVWSVDQAAGQAFDKPGELRVLEGGTCVFHDFGTGVSHIFTPEGKHVCAFAAQGNQPGQVPFYLNCFIDGSEIVIGAPSDLHFFAQDGRFVASYPNDLFARFPLAFLGDRVALLGPSNPGSLPDGIARIVRVDFQSGLESAFDELTIATSRAGGKGGGPVGIVRGLTPTIEAAWDRSLDRIYYGCSSDYVIHIARSDGSRLGAFSLERPRRPVDEAAKRAHVAEADLPAELAERMVAALPGEMASFRNLWAGEGLAYVLPPAGLARVVTSQPVDVFSAEGRYLYRAELRLPGEVRFSPDAAAIAGQDLYALCLDAQDRWSLRRFAVALPEANAR